MFIPKILSVISLWLSISSSLSAEADGGAYSDGTPSPNPCQNCSVCQYPCQPQAPPSPPPYPSYGAPPPPPPPPLLSPLPPGASANCCCQYTPPPPYPHLPYNNYSTSSALPDPVEHPSAFSCSVFFFVSPLVFVFLV